jgi:hypothetical protein
MFKCKVCAEKEKRITGLESEIAFLRDFVRPKVPAGAREVLPEQLEADAVISASTDQLIIDEKSSYLNSPFARLSAEEEAAIAEREALLGATY